MSDYLGLYGNIGVVKARCLDCKTHAFVVGGKLACCDKLVEVAPQIVKREACPEQERRLPALSERRAQLESQQHQCFYCERTFGSRVFRGTRGTTLQINWDHVIPYAYSQNNATLNFVAACHICNGLKSSHLFPTLDAAREFLNSKWRDKGYV
jgi:5-methylcytosine-specific restriction endonuclease McrA